MALSPIDKFPSVWRRWSYGRPFRLPGQLLGLAALRISGAGERLVRMRLGHQMCLAPSVPYLQRAIVSRAYHDEDVYFLGRFLTTGAVIVDVGANVGLLSCAYAQLHRQLSPTVHAIEAVAANFHLLEKNVHLNGFSQVHAHRLALGAEEGELVFKLPTAAFVGNAVGMNVLGPADAAHATATSLHEERVRMRPLDAWATEAGVRRCDFLKIDVEGAELSVLRGGAGLIDATRPLVQCEYNRHWLAGQGIGLEDFLAFFAPRRYAVYVDAGESYRPLTSHEHDWPLVDLLFIPQERLA